MPTDETEHTKPGRTRDHRDRPLRVDPKSLAPNKALCNGLFVPYESLTRPRLLAALRRLADLAEAEGIVLELSLYGGAVFTLVYGSRETTRDVDGVIRPETEGRRLAARVAREQELPDDWLSADVAQFLAAREEKRRVLEKDFGPGLRVTAPTAAYLLALKLKASRPRLPGYAGDEDDIAFLVRKIRPKSLHEVEELFARFFPDDALPDRTKVLVERVIKEAKQ